MAAPKKNVQLDKKTEITFKTVESLKASGNAMQDFIKAVTNYQKQAQRLSEAGKQLGDALQRVSGVLQNQQIDLGDGITKLAEIFKNMEMKREALSRSMQDDLVNSIQKSQKPEEAELAAFESDYKKSRDNARTQISKLEANSKKAGKKGPEALKQAIAQLNDKIKEADQIKADKLRTVLLLERKKYCNFLSQWGPVISAQVDMVNEEMKFKEQEQFWRNLASSSQQLPKNLEELIKSPTERTFVSIQSGDQNSDYSYADSYGYDDYYSGGNGGGGNYGGGNSYGGNTGGFATATAIYDFAGEQAEDLPFYAGDVINITGEDDGSGWLTGELNGRSGIFPSSYVQRN